MKKQVSTMGRKKTPRETSESQQQLMAAALDVIAEKGIDGATARGIADVAKVNQSLIFYYFGSVTALVIEAVSTMSARRFAVYEESLQSLDTLPDVAQKMFEVFIEDRKNCSFMVLSQFVTGAQRNKEIAAAVEKVFNPWIALTHDTLTKVFNNANLPYEVTYDDISLALMSLFMGVQFMESIPAYEGKMGALIEKFPAVTPLFAMLPLLMGAQK